MKIFLTTHKNTIIFSIVILFFILFFIFSPKIFSEHFVFESKGLALDSQGVEISTTTAPVDIFVPTHVVTPEPLKGIYMTSWVASNMALRDGLVKIADDTEINTIVIDIKDYTGKIVFTITNPKLKEFGSEEVRVKDMQEFVDTLHKKGIYVIGRIAIFQDAYFVKHRPDLAVKNKAGTAVWKDRKGISWIDPGSHEYWDYIILLAEETYKLGFDEINFDYIRFPSDGNMKDISYPWSQGKSKPEVMREFFEYLHKNLKTPRVPLGELGREENQVKISADMFGMVTTAQDDMGIGQVLEDALPYFDYIMPMVYPSHYPPTFQGFKNPATHPYEVVKFAMQEGVKRANLASTSPNKLRPWLQDFDLGADYGPAEVRAQIKATNDVGLTSWILWSASNKYTKSALQAE